MLHAAKVGCEFTTGSTVFVWQQGGVVAVPLAHVVGASVGLAVALVPFHAQR